MPRTDKTQKLESVIGQYIRLNYNVARDVKHPAVMFGGTLKVFKCQYYEIQVTGGTWIHFTDDDIENVWIEKETCPYIELKV